MHIPAQLEISSDEDRLILTAPGAAHFIDEYLRSGLESLSMRFAAAPYAGQPHMVIGLRERGRGVDLLVPADQCQVFRLAPTHILIRASAQNDTLVINVEWDEIAFSKFVDHIQDMHQQLPTHAVWSALAEVLVDD